MYTIWYHVERVEKGYQIIRFTAFAEAEEEGNGEQTLPVSSDKHDGIFAVGPQGKVRIGERNREKMFLALVEEEGLFADKTDAVKRANELNEKQGEIQGRVVTVNLHCREEDKPQVREACQQAIHHLELVTFAGFKKYPSDTLRSASGYQVASLSFWVRVDASVELAHIPELLRPLKAAMMGLEGVDACNTIFSSIIIAY